MSIFFSFFVLSVLCTVDIRVETENKPGYFAEEDLVGLGFVVVCFLYKINPNPRKIILLWEQAAQMPLLTLIFLGLGWPWVVGEFVGFIILFLCFPTPTDFGKS